MTPEEVARYDYELTLILEAMKDIVPQFYVMYNDQMLLASLEATMLAFIIDGPMSDIFNHLSQSLNDDSRCGQLQAELNILCTLIYMLGRKSKEMGFDLHSFPGMKIT